MVRRRTMPDHNDDYTDPVPDGCWEAWKPYLEGKGLDPSEYTPSCQGCKHWEPHQGWWGTCTRIAGESKDCGAVIAGDGVEMLTHCTFHCAAWEMRL